MLRESFNRKMAFGWYADGKMIAMNSFFTVGDYFKLDPPKCPRSKLYQIMGPYEKRIDQQLLEYAMKNGEMATGVLSYWGVVDPVAQSKKMAALFAL